MIQGIERRQTPIKQPLIYLDRTTIPRTDVALLRLHVEKKNKNPQFKAPKQRQKTTPSPPNYHPPESTQSTHPPPFPTELPVPPPLDHDTT